MLWEQWLAGLFVGPRLISADVKDAAADSRPMRVTLRFTVPGWAKADLTGGLEISRPLQSQLLAGDFASVPDLGTWLSLAERRTPLRAGSHSERFKLTIIAPRGFVFVGEAPPADEDTEPPPFITSPLSDPVIALSDTREVNTAATRLTLSREARLWPGRVPPGHPYTELRSTVRDLGLTLTRPIRLEPAR